MRIVRDFAALVAAFLGGCMWVMFIWNHCCSEKGDPADAAPSGLGLIALTGFVIVISLMFTRFWLVPVIVGLMPISLIDMEYMRFGAPSRFVWLAMVLPILLMLASAFLGSKLRNRMWPIDLSIKTRAVTSDT